MDILDIPRGEYAMVEIMNNREPGLIGKALPTGGNLTAGAGGSAFRGEAAFESLLKQALGAGAGSGAGAMQDPAALARTLMERMQIRSADRLLRLMSGSEAGEVREQDGKVLEQLLEAAARTIQGAENRPAPDAPLQPVPEPAASPARSGAARKGSLAASPELNSIIEKAADRYGVDPLLVRCVIRAESAFRPQSTSPKGAMGLMQLMPATARDLGVTNAYDPEQNVLAGTRYLKSLLDRYSGDVPRALAAYNWGMGNVDRRPDRLPSETREYVAGIMREYRKLPA